MPSFRRFQRVKLKIPYLVGAPAGGRPRAPMSYFSRADCTDEIVTSRVTAQGTPALA